MFGLARSIRYLRHGNFIRCVSVRYNSTKHNFFLSLRNNAIMPTKRSNISSAASPMKQEFYVVDHHLQQLNISFNKIGTVPMMPILQIIQHIQQTERIDSLRVIQVLRYCGDNIFECSPTQRIDLAKQLWDIMLMHNVPMDVTHYNTLLKVYLKNNYDFDPIKFLTEMKNKDISPNKDTYQHFIEYYCKKGDMNATVKVLECIKEEDISLNEAIFNLLIIGHSEAGDVNSAMQVLDMMQRNDISPTSNTYAMIMQVYAKQNNMNYVRSILRHQYVLNFTNKNIFDVMYVFIKNKNRQAVNELFSHLNKKEPFSIDDTNFIGKVIDIHETNIALNHLLDNMARVKHYQYRKVLMKSFLRRMLNSNVDTNTIGRVCLFLENSNVYKLAFYNTLQHATKFCDEYVILDLFRFLKKTTYEIRTHYFWPIFCKYAHKHNFQGILDTIDCMKKEFHLLPCFDTIKSFILPYNVRDISMIRSQLIDYGVSSETVDNAIVYSLLSSSRMRMTVKHIETYDNIYHCELLKRVLAATTYRCNDVISFVKISKMLTDEVVGSYHFCSMTECLKCILDIQPPNKGLILRIMKELERSNVVVEPMILDTIRTYLGDLGMEMTNMSLLSTELTLEAQVNEYFDKMMMNLGLKQFSEVLYLQTEMLQLIQECKQNDCFVSTIKRMETLDCLHPGVLHIIINFFCKQKDIENAKKYVYLLIDSKKNIDAKHCNVLKKYVRLLLENNATDNLLELFKKLKETTTKPWFRNFFKVLVKSSNKKESQIYLTAFKKIQEISPEWEELVISTNIQIGDLEEAVANFYLLSTVGLGAISRNLIMAALLKAENDVLMKKFIEICFFYHDKQSVLITFLKTYLEHDKFDEASILLKCYKSMINVDSIQRFVYKSILSRQITTVQKYLTLIRDAEHSEKKMIYEYILRVCYIKNDCSLASEIWMRMQEEKIVPSKALINEYANLFTINGQPVPSNLEENLSDKSNTNQVST